MMCLAVVLMSVICSGINAADDVTVSIEAPGVVTLGENFEFIVVINTKPSEFTPPALTPAFRILRGPNSSSSFSMNMINGKVTQSEKISYSYILQASTVGKHVIQPVKMVVGGKTYSSAPKTIEVLNPSQSGSDQAAAQGTSSASDGSTLYLRAIPEKLRVYNGEALPVTIKIFSRENLVSLDNPIFPEISGFYRQDVKVPPLNSLTRENVNGTIYDTGILSKFVFFPQKTGNLKIGSFSIDCGIEGLASTRSRSILDSFFDNIRTTIKTISSPELNIEVMPLPAGAPVSFTGGVGRFTISASVDKKELKTNEAFTLTVEIKGSGNIKLLEIPNIIFPQEFEVYDPKITNQTAESVTEGIKRIEYLIIPRITGEHTIPPIAFSYFNPSDKVYSTVSSGSVSIKVGEGKDSPAYSSGQEGMLSENIKYFGKDIRYIKGGRTNIKPEGQFFFGSFVFWFWLIVPLALFSVITYRQRARIRKFSDVRVLKHHKANKFAAKRLKKAAKYMESEQPEAFYEEVLGAMWGYLSDKLNIPTSDLSRERTVEMLSEAGADISLIEEIVQWLDTCEYARYAPSSPGIEMDFIYSAAENLIGKMQNTIRGKLKINKL